MRTSFGFFFCSPNSLCHDFQMSIWLATYRDIYKGHRIGTFKAKAVATHTKHGDAMKTQKSSGKGC